jgi:hypothetical protein
MQRAKDADRVGILVLSAQLRNPPPSPIFV